MILQNDVREQNHSFVTNKVRSTLLTKLGRGDVTLKVFPFQNYDSVTKLSRSACYNGAVVAGVSLGTSNVVCSFLCK